MPILWCAISAHGYGHAAQVVPVLNAAGRLVPDLRVVLRTQVPAWFFEQRLHVPWLLSPAEQDIGCIQRGPLEIDVEATWEAHRRLHADWEDHLAREAEAMRTQAPALVLADIPYLAIAAAARAGLPAVGLSSLSWDRVLAGYVSKEPATRREQLALIQGIEQAYASAEVMIRLAPGIPLTAFRKIADVGPVAWASDPAPLPVRDAVRAQPRDRLVLVAFGGVDLLELPFDAMEQMAPYRFLVSGPVPERLQRVHPVTRIPFPFHTVLASVDTIMTKPGYSTVVEAVATRRPVVYVRRHHFVDEQTLVDYLHRYGHGVDLSPADFAAGRWAPALDAALSPSSPPPQPPPPSGAQEAADVLYKYLEPRAGKS
ncbi:MAG: hypothetical protein ACREI3_09530 [Nitrospirales bacterium]